MDRTGGLDGADVDGPRRGGERRHWFSLIDKVYKPGNLRAAFAKVKANQGAAGVDHQTIEMFEADLEANLSKVSQQLREGTYRPQAVRRQWIPKPGRAKSGRWASRRCETGWCRRRCAGAGTDLRTGLCGAQLRVSSGAGLQRCAATRGPAAQGRKHLGRGCGPEKLLRHDPASES